MATNRYAMAVKRSESADPPADWFERLSRIEGVNVEGHAQSGAQFTATPEGLAAVREAFSADFHIEEVLDRSPI